MTAVIEGEGGEVMKSVQRSEYDWGVREGQSPEAVFTQNSRWVGPSRGESVGSPKYGTRVSFHERS